MSYLILILSLLNIEVNNKPFHPFLSLMKRLKCTAPVGAPASPDLPLGFCRQKPRLAAALSGCLRAFAMRVRRGSPLYNNKKIQGRGVRPRFSQNYSLKTKFF
ncbi:MAG: hypothetical protein PHP73_01600 [Candidatus Omnitrophica bacterium]|nr:hypothetical protein [Candidatus Omnitrophota bacterium]